MAFGRKKKQEQIIENPSEIPPQIQSPIQQLQQQKEQEVTPQAQPQVQSQQKVVVQTVVELPTRPIREEIVGDTKVIYQTIGELIEENNRLLKEIKQLAQEE